MHSSTTLLHKKVKKILPTDEGATTGAGDDHRSRGRPVGAGDDHRSGRERSPEGPTGRTSRGPARLGRGPAGAASTQGGPG